MAGITIEKRRRISGVTPHTYVILVLASARINSSGNPVLKPIWIPVDIAFGV
jgi:hypothetical protein